MEEVVARIRRLALVNQNDNGTTVIANILRMLKDSSNCMTSLEWEVDNILIQIYQWLVKVSKSNSCKTIYFMI